MADVRALLKAKRQEARITHPYAAYGGAGGGTLRCTACGVAVKFASAWEGHVGSKAHRAAVAGLKAKEERASSALLAKRKAEEQGGDDDGDEDEDADGDGDGDEEMEPQRPPEKRQRTEEREESGADAQTQTQRGAHQAFPMDFFSDPSRAAPTSDRGPHDEDDEMDQDQDQDQADGEGGATKTAAAAPKSQFEMEWAAFERDMQSRPRRRPSSQGLTAPPGEDGAEAEAAATADPREAYARATIAAEPELVPKFEGLPVSDARMEDEGEGPRPREGGVEERKVSEGDERKRKDREERELIMDRLLDEERAQEDAYNRVALLKNRVQMLKQKRELAKAKGKKADTDTQA